MDLYKKTLFDLSEKIRGASFKQKNIADVITEIIGIPINEDQISLKNGSVFVKVSPTIKTALFLRKRELLQELKKFNIKIIT